MKLAMLLLATTLLAGCARPGLTFGAIAIGALVIAKKQHDDAAAIPADDAAHACLRTGPC